MSGVHVVEGRLRMQNSCSDDESDAGSTVP